MICAKKKKNHHYSRWCLICTGFFAKWIYLFITIYWLCLYSICMDFIQQKRASEKFNKKMETVNNYWSLYLDSWGHSSVFIMLISEKQKTFFDANKTGLVIAWTHSSGTAVPKNTSGLMCFVTNSLVTKPKNSPSLLGLSSQFITQINIKNPHNF